MSVKNGNLVLGNDCYQKRLRFLFAEGVSKVLVIIFMLALYAVALACLNHACLGKRGGAAADNVEHVHAEQIGTVVNEAE